MNAEKSIKKTMNICSVFDGGACGLQHEQYEHWRWILLVCLINKYKWIISDNKSEWNDETGF